MKIILITGGSSGIGRAAAERLSSKGHRVYELSRRSPEYLRVTHLTADVTDERAVSEAVETVIRREGRLDVLICSAGMGISGAVEFTELSDAKRLFDVNFFGVVNVVKAALPYLRESRGRIVAVSSVAAALPIPFQAYYSASKAAVNAFVLAVRNEVKPYGVTVCAVMPGDTETGFTAAREKSAAGDDVYAGRIMRSVAVMEYDETHGLSPDHVGRVVVKAALRRHVAPLYTAGGKYKLFLLLAKLLPTRAANAIVGMIYGK